MVLKWTEWNYTDPITNVAISQEDAVARMRKGVQVAEINPNNTERITVWGRQMLAKATTDD